MLTWEFPPRIVGGIARHCLGLAKALAKEDHDLHVVTLEFPGTPSFEDVDGVKVHRVRVDLGHPNFITWTFIFNHFIEKEVAVLSRDVEFDIVHIHDWLTAPAGISSKRYLDKPLVSTVHSTENGRTQGLHNRDSYLIDGLEWWMTYEAKKIIICSSSMKGELEHHFRVPSDKIAVIPNAIDVSKYRRHVDQRAVKRRFGIGPYERLVLFVGRLVPQKGVEYLIRAVPNIIRQNGEVRIFITGDGWSKNYLEDLARATGYADRIRFLGFISDSELVELTVSADALVIPSVYEPFGIVALEGMAAGVPVVAADVGGLAEIVERDRTGVTVYTRNPESIAWGVNRVLSDSRYSERLIQNAKKKVEEVYSWEAVAKRTVEVYEEACRA
ncbi:MAG: glycosyltransferase family 4 protein [Candidatus Bathyarchaeota archaeon]|nr:glycosyltransferase family 4 protein [Candidatus Bathyarchaeota archaeon]